MEDVNYKDSIDYKIDMLIKANKKLKRWVLILTIIWFLSTALIVNYLVQIIAEF